MQKPMDSYVCGIKYQVRKFSRFVRFTFCIINVYQHSTGTREGSGSEVECLTGDRGAAGSSLTGVTALWSLGKTHLS